MSPELKKTLIHILNEQIAEAKTKRLMFKEWNASPHPKENIGCWARKIRQQDELINLLNLHMKELKTL